MHVCMFRSMPVGGSNFRSMTRGRSQVPRGTYTYVGRDVSKSTRRTYQPLPQATIATNTLFWTTTSHSFGKACTHLGVYPKVTRDIVYELETSK